MDPVHFTTGKPQTIALESLYDEAQSLPTVRLTRLFRIAAQWLNSRRQCARLAPTLADAT